MRPAATSTSRSPSPTTEHPRTSVPLAEKLFRAALLIPSFATLTVFLRLRERFGRPLCLPGRTNHGTTLLCRLPDLTATYIWEFGEWEPELTRFIASRLRDGDVFVGVGALSSRIRHVNKAAAAKSGTVTVFAGPATRSRSVPP
ncbi:hypothetical protein ACXDF8_17440 [Mycolicibacterium sp. CBM1]